MPFKKLRGCDLALHWLPFGFGETDGTCGFSSAGSRLQESACFWNNCVEETELFGLVAPNVVFRQEFLQESAADPKCGEEEPLFGGLNPSPLQDGIRHLYVHHAHTHTCVVQPPPGEGGRRGERERESARERERERARERERESARERVCVCVCVCV